MGQGTTVSTGTLRLPGTRLLLLLGIGLLGLGLLCPLPPASALEGEPAPAPAAGEGKGEGLEELRKEMEGTYLEVQRDFEALRGEKAAEHVARLAGAVAKAAAGAEGGRVPDAALPGLWTGAGLLGPVVAERLASCYAAEAAAGGEPAAVIARAVLLVFPEPTMADNWDRHFLDLDVVKRWRAASGPPAKPDPADPAAGPAAGPAAPDPSDMVLVPRGDLLVPEGRGRGWPDPGQKAEKRTVRAFYLDRTEVTGAAYLAFLEAMKDGKLRERILPTGWTHGEKGAVKMPEGAGPLPVTGVPYEGAAAFAAFHGKRLPTEDEWERAARGAGNTKFPWGPEWVEGNAVVGGRPGPAPAGSTPGDRSSFGILDLCGNVSEFCATYADGKPVKGTPRATDQVVRRGGNYAEKAEEAANDWRWAVGPVRNELVGFRCAMDERDYERKFGRK
ncbi:MAG: formylglycine-generating enzyme family protein [Planctomycetes bacterium]|nr:formylglycine-generating enzyme family protein [Planctomycetota bacterium]